MADGNGGTNGRRKLGRHLFSGASRRIPYKPAASSPRLAGDDLATGGPGDFDPIRPGMDWRPPAGMAELYITPEEQDGSQAARNIRGQPYSVLATCCCMSVRKLEVYGDPDLDLRELTLPTADKPLGPYEILGRMKDWSRAKAKLSRWLDDRRAAHQDGLQLVIWDNSTFCIPWELFWLTADPRSQRQSEWLGALMRVTRWADVRTGWPEILRPFRNPDPYQGNGAIAAYIAAAMRHDQTLLDGLAVERAASMPDLLRRLNATTSALAMVYIACHGEFSDDPAKSTLDEFSVQLAAALSDDGLARLREQATLVFLNACHSGAINVNMGNYNDGALRGFAEVFLRAGASGVLAATGAVGENLAHELAGVVLGHLRENSGVSVTEALRARRAAAAAQMNAVLSDFARLDFARVPEADRDEARKAARNRADEALLKSLYLFMYVYYGSPRMMLSVARGPAGEHAGTGG